MLEPLVDIRTKININNNINKSCFLAGKCLLHTPVKTFNKVGRWVDASICRMCVLLHPGTKNKSAFWYKTKMHSFAIFVFIRMFKYTLMKVNMQLLFQIKQLLRTDN